MSERITCKDCKHNGTWECPYGPEDVFGWHGINEPDPDMTCEKAEAVDHG